MPSRIFDGRVLSTATERMAASGGIRVALNAGMRPASNETEMPMISP